MPDQASSSSRFTGNIQFAVTTYNIHPYITSNTNIPSCIASNRNCQCENLCELWLSHWVGLIVLVVLAQLVNQWPLQYSTGICIVNPDYCYKRSMTKFHWTRIIALKQELMINILWGYFYTPVIIKLLCGTPGNQYLNLRAQNLGE